MEKMCVFNKCYYSVIIVLLLTQCRVLITLKDFHKALWYFLRQVDYMNDESTSCLVVLYTHSLLVKLER